MELYSIKDLTFYYPERKAPALENINLKIEEGDFTVICGKSGCGKTTLLRHLKKVLSPHGRKYGDILFLNHSLEEMDLRAETENIGFVSQNPDNQIVTDKVWHELAFGLESLGFDNDTIRLRVAEMASFFGIEDWFSASTTALSGGQKQLLSLASVLAMQPKALILDEPTSQLDPIAASNFLNTVKRINHELGITIIMTEHRLEEVFPMADKVAVMENGRLLHYEAPDKLGKILYDTDNGLMQSLPSAVRIFSALEPYRTTSPLTVRDGRVRLNAFLGEQPVEKRSEVPTRKEIPSKILLELKDIWFKYEKDGPDILKGFTLEVPENQIYALMGGNGAGKTTVLSLITGLLKAYRGKIRLEKRRLEQYSRRELFEHFLGVLPQNPQSLFLRKTVELDLMEMLKGKGYDKTEIQKKIGAVSELTEIHHLLSVHPYDLSGGEQQRAALAKVLLLEPKLLLLDEPTKGFDSCFKNKFSSILKRLTEKGVTILMVSHDVEFCAKNADICGLCFQGGVVAAGKPGEFFGGNSFYTTAANRIARHMWPGAITEEEVIERCKNTIDKRIKNS